MARVPEGNTVWRTAQALRRALAGHDLTGADLRVAAYATSAPDLAGRRVLDVAPRGKHLLIRLAGRGDGGLTLHSHLRMDGAWRVHPAGWVVKDARDAVRAVLTTATATAVGYRLHDIALVPTDDEATLVGHLGPDLLGPDWDAARAVGRLRNFPRRPIGIALLDQRNLAGAGNIYKCESCFLAGVSPFTPVGEVADLPALVDLVHRLLSANRERHRHVTTGDVRNGRALWVFDRAGRPCLRCGTPISSAWQDDEERPERRRITYWCRNCQPGPAPEQRQGPAPRARS